MRTIIMCKYWLRLSLAHAVEIQVYHLPPTNSNELNWGLSVQTNNWLHWWWECRHDPRSIHLVVTFFYILHTTWAFCMKLLVFLHHSGTFGTPKWGKSSLWFSFTKCQEEVGRLGAPRRFHGPVIHPVPPLGISLEVKRSSSFSFRRLSCP